MDALTGYGSEDSSSDSDTTIPPVVVLQPLSSSTIKSPPPPPSTAARESLSSPSPLPLTTPKLIDKTSIKGEKKSDPLTGLLSAYSHTDENENEDELNISTTTTTTTNNSNGTKKRCNTENASNGKIQPVAKQQILGMMTDAPKRRRRRWDNAEVLPSSNTYSKASEAVIESPVLPRPRLAGEDDTPFDALILFPKDYITPFSRRHQRRQAAIGIGINGSTAVGNRGIKSIGIRLGLAEKLDSMYNNFYSTTTVTSKDGGKGPNGNSNNNGSTVKSFANHLKAQKEFGNPHLFPSIIQHFGIDPMGSNIPKSMWDPKNDFAPFEYVERIVAKEEENRLRGRK